MKSCQVCHREYADDSMNFCLDDGSPLITAAALPDTPTLKLSHENFLSRSSERSQPSIAVLPFANLSADPENEYFCDGLAEQLLNALAKIEGLKVVARSSAFAFKGKDVDVREIGRRLDVSNALEGSVRRAGDRLRVTAQIINVADGFHIWSDQFDRQMDDVFAIQDEISLAIIDGLKVKLMGADKAALFKRYTENTEAYHLYLKGRFCQNKWTAVGIRKSIELFNQAIALDSGYALAYAGLADSYASLGASDSLGLPAGQVAPIAKSAALKALELDDSLTEAHTSLGLVKLNHEWDLEGAGAEFERALELNHNNPIARHWYSHYLVAKDQLDKSLLVSKQALELSPLDLEFNGHLAWHYFFARDYDHAIEQALKTIQLDPAFVEAYHFLSWAYIKKGLFQQAIATYGKIESLEERHGVTTAWLGHAYGLSGDVPKARECLVRLNDEALSGYVSSYYRAVVFLGLGDKDTTFEFLNKALAEREAWMIYLNQNPIFDSLRPDPRFRKLVEAIGLPARSV